VYVVARKVVINRIIGYGFFIFVFVFYIFNINFISLKSKNILRSLLILIEYECSGFNNFSKFNPLCFFISSIVFSLAISSI